MELSACNVVNNGADEALRAAQTVLDCTRRHPLILYLVDNASPDGSGQRLAKAAKDGTLHIREDQKVEVLCRTENGGFGTGHNTVLSLLHSRAMVYRQLPCLKFWARYNERYLMADRDLTSPTEIEFCTGSFSAVDTVAFKAVGGFDEDYFMYVEDADLTQKMRTRGKAYLVPQYTAIHAWHRAAHRSLKPFLWQLHSLLRYFSKWGFAW